MALADLFGNSFLWDANGVAGLGATGDVQWTSALYPSTTCPGFLTQLTLTNESTFGFGIGALAEGFTVLPNGLPVALVTFSGFDNGTCVFPACATMDGDSVVSAAPPPNASGSGSGFFRPIAPLAVTGPRIVYLCRWYAGGSAPSLSLPSPHLYLLAVDQNSGSVARLHWAWRLLLPTRGTVLEDPRCQPRLAESGQFEEALAIAGPAVVEDAALGAAVAIVSLSCLGSTVVLASDVRNLTSEAGFRPASRWLAALALGGGADTVSSLAVDARSTGHSSVWLATSPGGHLLHLDAGSGLVWTNISLDAVMGGEEGSSDSSDRRSAAAAAAAASAHVFPSSTWALVTANCSGCGDSAQLMVLPLQRVAATPEGVAAAASFSVAALRISSRWPANTTAELVWEVPVPSAVVGQPAVIAVAGAAGGPALVMLAEGGAVFAIS